VIGTPSYSAPEICNGQPYNERCDIWSLGCIFYEMLTLEKAFDAPVNTSFFKFGSYFSGFPIYPWQVILSVSYADPCGGRDENNERRRQANHQSLLQRCHHSIGQRTPSPITESASLNSRLDGTSIHSTSCVPHPCFTRISLEAIHQKYSFPTQ